MSPDRARGVASRLLAALAALLAGAVLSSAPAPARDTLRLRVNDAIAEPGGLAAVVIRTYASRPIGQGQICFTARRASGGGTAEPGPFASLEGYEVFASRDDALSIASIETSADGQTIVVEFSSDSATINKKDGPLAVVFFRLRDSVSPGERFRIRVDPGNTVIFGSDGSMVPLEPRAGTLKVRRPGAAYEIEADDDKIEPGERAELGVETYEPFRISEGQVGFRFDPEISAGRAKVKMNKRHGKRRFRVDRSTPGLLLVSFRSKKADLNRVPGQIISIKMPTPASIPVGTRSPITLDPGLTFLFGAEGESLPLELENGTLVFRDENGGGEDD